MGAAILTPELLQAPRPSPHASQSVTVEIGDIPILLRPNDSKFCEVLEDRYAGFTNPDADPTCQFDIQLDPKGRPSDEDAKVTRHGALWSFQRGDFRATWDARARHGRIRQCPNPYSIDTVLRITHSLVLAEEGGFLVHAASAIRGRRAFLFAGVSGAGKTTIARLTPPDATVLTDEISYVRRIGNHYQAYGTPFAGELARAGENCSAQVSALFFLEKGPENRVDELSSAEAVRRLLRNILFFAGDQRLVEKLFATACDFVGRVPIRRLTFYPDARVWDEIRSFQGVPEHA